jgi:hypothetical protein
MATDRDEIRASDADRERTVEQLRQYTAEGRLTMDEFEERMSAAYAATTYGDLSRLTRDMPVELGSGAGRGSGPSGLPGPVDFAASFGMTHAQRHAARAAMRAQRDNARLARRGQLAGAVASWASMSVLLTGIWLITGIAGGGFHTFWPAWPIGVFGLILLTRAIRAFGGGHGR